MQKQQYKKLTFDFPTEEYVYLKMSCAKQHVSMKEFVTNAIVEKIEAYEDELDAISLKEITDEDRANAAPWEEVEKRLGWDKL